MKRSKDQLLTTHPCEIFIKHTHNHLIDCADVLRHRRPNQETENKILDLFTRGHSPSSALDMLKCELQELYNDEYYRVSADGASCPSLQWVYHKYYCKYNKEYGAPDGLKMIESLKCFVEKYNSRCGSECAKYHFGENNELAVAICTPLMKRVHENLKSSSEIMFVDASGSMDRHCSRVFTFLAPSLAGALPLGLLILFSESEDIITRGLTILKTILPKKSFFGHKEAAVIMTDDSTSERNSLRTAFPESTLLLCRFHILQAFWRYLLNGNNRVERSDASVIFNLFRKILMCKTENDVSSVFNTIIGSDVVKKYSNVVSYIKRMQERSSEWVPAFTAKYLTRGHTTNNYSESNFRNIKDKVMLRLKAYSVVQLFDFMTTRYESFFERKLADFLANRIANCTRSRYNIHIYKTTNLVATRLCDNIFLVKNKDKLTEYQVNTLIEHCTCPTGDQGSACKHQLAVCLQFNLSNNQLMVKSDYNTKYIMHMILTGSAENLPKGWYTNISEYKTPSSISLNVEDHNEGTSVMTLGDDNMVVEHDALLHAYCTDGENHVESNDCSSEVASVQDDLQRIFTQLKEHTKDPEMLSSCQAFIRSFDNLKTKASLASSLHSFGKNQIYHSRKLNKINVQPTSVARRKTYLGGRKHQHTGRPAKRHFTPEHGYSLNKNKQPQWLVPTSSKKLAPHSLSYCVEQNSSLGSKH